MDVIQLIGILFRALLANRAAPAMENPALRQQLAVLERSVKRPALQQRDRIFWAWLSRLWNGWRMPVILEGESFRGPPGIGRLRNVSKSLVMA